MEIVAKAVVTDMGNECEHVRVVNAKSGRRVNYVWTARDIARDIENPSTAVNVRVLNELLTSVLSQQVAGPRQSALRKQHPNASRRDCARNHMADFH